VTPQERHPTEIRPGTPSLKHLHLWTAKHRLQNYAHADDLAMMHADGDWQAVEGVLSKDKATVGEYLQTWKLSLSRPTIKTVSAVFHLNNKEAKRELLLSFERVLLLSSASPPRYRDRCWAAIRLSHRPEQSGRVVRGGVDWLDSRGWHGRRFVLRHTQRPQRRLYPICTGRSGNVRHRCGSGWAWHKLFLWSFRGCVYRCLELKWGVLWGYPPTPHSVDDPTTAPHVCCCC